MATFNGINLFGVATVVGESSLNRESQINAYPGVNGLEHLDGGTRGTPIRVGGWLVGTDATDLSNQKITFTSYLNGLAYVLVDSLGATWPNVVLKQFAPANEI
jgi:hypothetical protein